LKGEPFEQQIRIRRGADAEGKVLERVADAPRVVSACSQRLGVT
jgi:hypothetical protein